MADKSEGLYGLWKEAVPSDYRWYLQTLFGEKLMSPTGALTLNRISFFSAILIGCVQYVSIVGYLLPNVLFP